MGNRKRIKKINSKSPKITADLKNNVDYPIFCFKHLKIKPRDDHKFYSGFIQRLNKISGLNWKSIMVEKKHGYGTEKIPISIIKPDLPKFISPDVTELTAFRANGDNRPFLGIRNGNIFHIIFIEEKFGDVYDH